MRRLLVCALVVLAVAESRAATNKFRDAFLNSGGAEDLITQSNHHTDVGTPPFWTESVDTAGTTTLTADTSDVLKASASANSNRIIYTATPSSALGSADYDLYWTVKTAQSGQSDDDLAGLIARFADGNNYYGLVLTGNSTQAWQIIKRVGGTASVLKSGNRSHSVNDIYKFTLRGDTLKAYANGSLLDCVVDTDLSAAGSAGVGLGNLGTTTTADVTAVWEMDDFTADDATGDGGDDDCSAGVTPRGLLMGIFP